MTGIDLYRDTGLEIYEKAHYSHGEDIREVEAILSWYGRQRSRVLDLGCSGGLHALEMAKRGHWVTGVDMETTAIGLARERSRSSGLDAEFLVADLEELDPATLGRFDLVYSLGNVISHIPKISLPGLLARVRSCLAMDGIFLFDILTIGESFPESIIEEDLGITWKRRLDRETGEIFLRGIFERFGVNQDFRVWGHDPDQVTGLLREAGFSMIDVSPALDFATPVKAADNSACLRYRAQMEEGK
jgi:SAM-dependent methyltransferase